MRIKAGKFNAFAGFLGWLTFVCACSSGSPGPDPSAIPSVPSEEEPGTRVTAPSVAALADLEPKLTLAREASSSELRSNYPVEFDEELGYDPTTAQNLDPILEALVWSEPELVREKLAATGFAIANDTRFPSFAYGYSSIYAADLPVFVSADMVLEALYRSHDKILQALEQETLVPRLRRLLQSLRANLLEHAALLSPGAASDLNFYLGVAESLLNGGRVESNEPDGVAEFVRAALAAAGEQERVLFGVRRSIDFSQFKPRGHYAGDPELESYFRAMIWLGRIDFRLIETESDGSSRLRRGQVEAMIGLAELLDESSFADYQAIDHTISLLVGEHDYMTIEDTRAFLAALGDPESLGSVDDETLVATLVEGQFGEQRIASHVMRRSAAGAGAFPLNVSFALFGQRYTVDSHVFSRVVYDRVPTRVVPDPLDVAFGALGNNQALGLLGDELDSETGYPGQLSEMRLLVDAHSTDYWQSSIYTAWLSSLRALSPASSAPDSTLPSVARSDAWGRRLLNTQLASWAELRHNNVLYVKQSYTSAASCEYPDAYVDPYPDFFLRVVELAEHGQRLASELGLSSTLGTQISSYFERVGQINATLAEMAEFQRTGSPHSAEHLAFINRAVTANINCDGSVLGHDGWYADLHFDPLQAVEADPCITDVHTDIGGELPVLREPSVLHVGTGEPRLILVTVDSCQGPRAYAGVVSSYHQMLEPGLTRLTDEEWEERLYTSPPPEVPWLTPILAGN